MLKTNQAVKNYWFTNNGLPNDKICHVNPTCVHACTDMSSKINPHCFISANIRISKGKFWTYGDLRMWWFNNSL